MAAGTVTHDDRSLQERPSAARLPDVILRWTLTAIAVGVLALIAFFFIRLYGESRPLFDKVGIIDFVFSDAWAPSKTQCGPLPPLVGTLITSVIALAIGVPIAVAAAVYVTEPCPRRIKSPL